MYRFQEPNCLLFQFLSTFITIGQDFCYSDMNSSFCKSHLILEIFWEAIPGFFMYLQVFYTMFQFYLIQRSSQYILRRNVEEKMEFHFYAESCMYNYL